jgi:sulfotransferase
MVNNFHVISGLPRSGSTLLSAILQQNPRFRAGITSPLLALCEAVQDKMNQNSEFSGILDDQRRRAVLRGVVQSYYYETSGPENVIFDTNRLWTAKLALLKDLYPNVRLICCVRDIGWIIDSIEKMLRTNPLQHSRIFNFKRGSTVYGRAEILMNAEKGLIGLPWSALREAWFGEEAKRLIVVRYDSLTRDPGAVISCIYRELGEPSFAHDFDNVVYDAPAYDAELGMPGLHRVAPKVRVNDRKSCIPPDLFAQHANLSFWNRPELNTEGLIVL